MNLGTAIAPDSVFLPIGATPRNFDHSGRGTPTGPRPLSIAPVMPVLAMVVDALARWHWGDWGDPFRYPEICDVRLY
jgi:hypothetical protein